MFDLFLGTLLAVLTVLLFRRASPPRERALWALALAVAALVYVAFAVAAGSSSWTAVELGGLLVYGTAAFLGWRVSPWFLAAGWWAHVGWDVALHGGGDAPFVPAWYPRACIAYDVLVGVYLAVRATVWSPRESVPATPCACAASSCES